MRISGKKINFEKEELTLVAEAQDKAFEIVSKHLAVPLKHIESLGYSRLELACAYLMLAYHALRLGKPKEQADHAFNALSYLARKRMEIKFQERRKKKLH